MHGTLLLELVLGTEIESKMTYYTQAPTVWLPEEHWYEGKST